MKRGRKLTYKLEEGGYISLMGFSDVPGLHYVAVRNDKGEFIGSLSAHKAYKMAIQIIQKYERGWKGKIQSVLQGM